MNIENIYAETFEILSYMDKMTVMKIPVNVLSSIKNLRNKNFKTNIDKNDIFNENNISKETVDLLCWLDYTYWSNENEKEEINNIIKENNRVEEINKRERYNPDNLFVKNNQPKVDINTSLIEYKEITFMQRIKAFLKRIFRR